MAEPDCIKIPLSDGAEAVIDANDAHLVEGRRWHINGYDNNGRPISVSSGRRGERVLMHTVIAQPPDGKVVDHVNGDALDNRRKNLRVCTQSENLINRKINANNRSGFKGVYLDSESGKYRARIGFNGKKRCLGYFASAEEAAEAYKDAAKRYHGPFIRR